jgi:hypothetical protein
MPFPRVILKALALIALSLSAATARANAAAPIPSPSLVGGPRLAAKTPLVVREERLSFQCDEVNEGPVCSFEARYRIENPSSEPAGGRAAFYGLRAENIVVLVDGRRSDVSLSPEDIKALDASVVAAEEPPPEEPPITVPAETRPEEPAPEVPEPEATAPAATMPEAAAPPRSIWHGENLPIRQGFELSVPPSGRAEIVVTGRMLPGRTRYSRGYVYTPAEGRHLLLHAGDTELRIFELDYLVSPIKTWADVHRLIITIRYPKSWGMGTDIYGQPNRAQVEWKERVEGDFVIKSTDTLGKVDPKAIGNKLELFVSLPGAQVEHGGPFIGVGGVVNASNAKGFRMRFGYEIAAPSWAVHSITADTDFDRRLVIAPNVEAALPHVTLIPILPSLSLGVGVPVQIMPIATVGARVLGTVQLWAIGFVTSIDIFPGLSPDEGLYQVTLLARGSL